MVAHLDHFKHGIDGFLDLGLRLLGEPERKRDVVPYRHCGEQRIVLEDCMHTPHIRRRIRDVFSVKVDAAAVRALESAEHTEKSGLPAS